MSTKKTIDTGSVIGVSDIGGGEGGQGNLASAPTSEVVVEEPAPAKFLSTIADAIAVLKKDYTVPKGHTFVYVASDRTVFWEENVGSARAYAITQKLKLFEIPCQDLVK